MDNQIKNIEQSIRDKFDTFTPVPPSHIWEGVKLGAAVQAKPTFFAAYGKQLAVAASILLIGVIGLWWILPGSSDENTISENTDIELIIQSTVNSTTDNTEAESDFQDVHQDASESISKTSKNSNTLTQDNLSIKKTDEADANLSDQVSPQISENTTLKEEKNTISVSNNNSVANSGKIEIKSELSEIPQQNLSEISSITAISLAVDNEPGIRLSEYTPVATEIVFQNPQKSKSKWTSGIYLTAEFMLNDFDSVQLLPSYSMNYEPTYHFSNHLFLRFGAGMNYARDRGFAQIDYRNYEVVGTYEDVYDITFDSIDGEVVPTYHTKTTDLWDSVQHVQVSEITNKYLYLQTPVLFGYYKKNTRFNWYFYGGPAFNVLVSKQIANPESGLEGVDIVDLENNLPERSPYFMQLWVGAGIEYKVGKKTALSFEPNYRYYFNNVYKNDPYKKALSSFSLRFGVVFTMK